jgi:cytochrome-b5 reductase
MPSLLVSPAWLVIISIVVVFGYHYVVKPLLNKSSSTPALSQEEYRQFPLIQKTHVTHNTVIFRFGLPSKDSLLGLPIGKHLVLRFMNAEGKPVSRQYTPITTNSQRGYFELLIKLYPQGQMSTHLSKLQVGEKMEIRGPMGMLEYVAPSTFRINRGGWNTYTSRHIGMIAGGTGITPMYQVSQYILNNAKDTTDLSLIFANVSEDDILLRKELEEFAENRSNFKLYHCLNNAPADWKQGVGFVSEAMIRERLPPATEKDALILLCGPKPMVDAMEKHLRTIGYTDEQMFKF